MEHKKFSKLMGSMIALTALALLFFGTPAFAGEAILTWQPPIQNVDNSPYTNPGGFKIYYGLTGQTQTAINIPDTTNTVSTYTIPNLTAGTWDFYVTAYNSSGVESTRAGPASKLITTGTPLPPTLMFVVTAPAVYNVIKRDNGFVLVYVGQVSLNTPCDITQSVNGYYAVARSAVTSWAGTVKPIVVVAQCSAQ